MVDVWGEPGRRYFKFRRLGSPSLHSNFLCKLEAWVENPDDVWFRRREAEALDGAEGSEWTVSKTLCFKTEEGNLLIQRHHGSEPQHSPCGDLNVSMIGWR